MYIKSLHLYDFRCFRKAALDFQYPGRPAPASQINNINLLLGNNGGGKSSVLRALAIAALAPVLKESGFVPYHLVRRPDAQESLVKVDAVLDLGEAGRGDTSAIELLARLQRRSSGNIDALSDDRTPKSPLLRYLEDDSSSAFFVVGYGATRRVETGDYSESSLRRARGLRYHRVASLFEDQVTLKPLHTWLPRQDRQARVREVRDIFARILPKEVRFTGEFDSKEQQYIFDYEDRSTPFAALSDGYRAFVGWVGDLFSNLCDVAPANVGIDSISGLVLIDEIDLHLHPDWQRSVVPAVAAALPKLQFVLTSHSPLVAGTIYSQNIFVTEAEPDGTATIRQIEERAHGRSAEQLLLSSYFGLQTTRAESFQAEAKSLFSRAAKGEPDAALEYVERLIGPTSNIAPLTQTPSSAVAETSPRKSKKRRAKKVKKKKPKRASTRRIGTTRRRKFK